jgi:hypothetical protein
LLDHPLAFDSAKIADNCFAVRRPLSVAHPSAYCQRLLGSHKYPKRAKDSVTYFLILDGLVIEFYKQWIVFAILSHIKTPAEVTILHENC